jgi:competence protein ComEC
MRSLTAWLLLAFACGVCTLQTCAQLPPWPLALALVAAVTLALAMLVSRVGAVAAALALGFAYAALRADVRLADSLPREWEGEDIRVVGVVDDLPAQSDVGVRFALAVDAVRTPRAQVPSRLSLAWFASRDDEDAVPVVHAGERWQLTVRLRRPHGNVNPGGFDLEAWLLQQNLRATGYVLATGSERIDAFAGRFRDHVQRARESVRERIFRALDGEPYAGVIVALAIGDQRAIAESQWTVFNRTGIGHLVSISGLHVTVFAAFAGGIAFALARRVVRLTSRLPARKVAVAVGVVAAGTYTLLAGAEVPAGANLRDARRGRMRKVARPPRHCRDCVAVGVGRRAGVGSVGVAHAGFWLSYAPSHCFSTHRQDACAIRPQCRGGSACPCRARGHARAVGGDRWVGAARARTVRADVAHRTAGQRDRDPCSHAGHRSARAGGHIRAVSTCSSNLPTRRSRH